MTKQGRKPYDLTNQRFGKLTTIDSPKIGYWRCICDCGKEKVLRTGILTSTGTKSCGCLRDDVAKSEKNVKRLKKSSTRTGKRKCRRCKTVWYRPRGEIKTICERCRTYCVRCNIKLTKENRDPHATAYQCRSCTAEVVAKTKGNAGFKQRDYDLMRNYGITADEYAALQVAQDSKCYICLREPSNNRLAVDHKHLPGEKRRKGPESQRQRVRGLLCWRCNAGLAKYNDNPSRLRRAAEYLETSPAQSILARERLIKQTRGIEKEEKSDSDL